jgi:hypothetical protein
MTRRLLPLGCALILTSALLAQQQAPALSTK